MKQAIIIWTSIGIGFYIGQATVKKAEPVVLNHAHPDELFGNYDDSKLAR